MKQIVVDFLRRWWGGYLLAVLFVGVMAAVTELETTFAFVGVLILPLACERSRRPFGVMATLPVSRRTIALSYWGVAVVLPVLLMTASVMLVGLLFHSSAVSLKDVAVVLIGSLALAGTGCWLLTFVSQGGRESGVLDFFVLWLGTMWSCSVVFRVVHHEFYGVTPQSPLVYLAGLIGLLLTVWGYLRSEKLLFGRARKHLGGGQPSGRSPQRIPSLKPRMARFGGVFFDLVWRAFLAGLIVSTLLSLSKMSKATDKNFWTFLLVFGGTGSIRALSGGLRLLRSLPISVGQLSLNLLLMPLLAILAVIAGMALIQLLNLGHSLSSDLPTFLIPMTGAVCCTCSLIIPFSGRGDEHGFFLAMFVGMVAAFAIFVRVADVKWPPAFWWLLGLCLMAAAFFMNRHWLRSSASYRAATGDSLRRQR